MKPRTVCACHFVAGHDLRECRAFGALQHGDDCGLLVGAIRFRLGRGFLRAAAFFATLASPARLRAVLGCASGAGAFFGESIVLSLIGFS